jgi:hypothetical protein
MKHTDRNTKITDYQRYLENKMSLKERNIFERHLQTDPFESEALEGLDRISPSEMQENLKELNRRIKLTNKKSQLWIWGVAASVLIIIVGGIALLQLNVFERENELAAHMEMKYDNTNEKHSPPLEQDYMIDESELLVSTNVSEGINNNKKTVIESEVKEVAKKYVPIVKKPDYITKKEVDTEEITIKEPVQTGKNLLAMDSELPDCKKVSNVSNTDTVLYLIDGVVNKLRLENEITNNTSNYDLISQENSAMNSQLSKSDMVGGIYLENSEIKIDNYQKNGKAYPAYGKESFERYINEKALLDSTYPKKRIVIKLLLDICINGEITNISNLNNGDSALYNRAKELIHKGPDWVPEIKNGFKQASSVELKIVFRKKAK